MTKQNCVYSYILTPTNTCLYLYRHVEYLQFLRMEFSSLSTVGNPEDSLSFLPSLFCSSNFPFRASTTAFSPITHIVSSPPLLISITYFPLSSYLTGNLLWSSVQQEEGMVLKKFTQRIFNIPSQRTRPLILNTRQRCN